MERSHTVPLVKVDGGWTARSVEEASEQSPERDEARRVNAGLLTSDLHGGCGPKLTHGLDQAPLAGRDTLPTAHHH